MMRYSQNCYHKVKIIKLLKKKEKRMFSSNTLRSDKGGSAFYMLL